VQPTAWDGFHPTIDFLFQISTKFTPELGLGIHKKEWSLIVHSQLKKSHNPLVFSYNYLDFPPSLFLLTFPTQGMYPFTDIIPSASHSFIRVSLTQVTRNITIGNSRELTARKTTSKQQKLVVTVQLTQEFTLQS
jgi:hypothetical protein